MTPQQPPDPGPTDATTTAASRADENPEDTTPAPAPEAPPTVLAPPSVLSIPDHDPFVDTDVVPEIGPGRHPTGGFAGLAAPPPTLASSSPVAASVPVPGNAPTEVPPAPPVSPDEPHTSPRTTPVQMPPAPAVAPVPTGAPAVTPPGPPTVVAPPGLVPGNGKRPGKGLLIGLGALAAVVLLGAGAVGGALVAGGSGDGGEVAAASSAPATTRPVTPTTRARPSTTTRPRPSTTNRPTAPASAVPTTAATATSVPAGPAALVADFAWDPDPAQAGRTVKLVDRSSGDPTRWTWQWDGNVVSSTKPNGVTTAFQRDTDVTLTVCRGATETDCASVTKTVTVAR